MRPLHDEQEAVVNKNSGSLFFNDFLTPENKNVQILVNNSPTFQQEFYRKNLLFSMKI